MKDIRCFDEYEQSMIQLEIIDSNESSLGGVIRATAVGEPIEIYKIKRSNIKDAKKLRELQRAGIYFLIREYDEPACYVGRSSSRRGGAVARAVCGKHGNQNADDIDDFWDYALIIVPIHTTFTTSILYQLEYAFIEKTSGTIAKQKNAISGQKPKLGSEDSKWCKIYEKSISNIMKNGFGCGFLFEKASNENTEAIIPDVFDTMISTEELSTTDSTEKHYSGETKYGHFDIIKQGETYIIQPGTIMRNLSDVTGASQRKPVEDARRECSDCFEERTENGRTITVVTAPIICEKPYKLNRLVRGRADSETGWLEHS